MACPRSRVPLPVVGRTFLRRILGTHGIPVETGCPGVENRGLPRLGSQSTANTVLPGHAGLLPGTVPSVLHSGFKVSGESPSPSPGTSCQDLFRRSLGRVPGENCASLAPAPWAEDAGAGRERRPEGGAGGWAQLGAMSRRAKDDFLRHYTVSDPRTHPKGYTEYKVTAQFISKRDPEDVKEVVVWKRYSDFRKLHGDLAYTHRNLFRRLEEFPAFPRAQVFGRFEASVIEERRKGAEDLLRFTVHIPALNNSPQLKEFFRGGEVTRPAQVSRDLHILPPPLIPTPPPEELQPPPDESWLPQPLPAEKRGLEELEVPAEPLPSSPAQEALDLLFNCGSTEEASSSPARGPLTEAELALFDPFSKEEGAGPSPAHTGELTALEAEPERPGQEAWEPGGLEEEEDKDGGPTPAYLSQATELITQALRDEKAGAYPAALQGYRDGVHILLQGVPGDPSPARREGVKKKAAEYLKRAEEILSKVPP